jgi:hypothetical protein
MNKLYVLLVLEKNYPLRKKTTVQNYNFLINIHQKF